MSFRIKICGLSTAPSMLTALDCGADMVGLVFHPRSPRHVGLDDAAMLAALARGRAERVALLVDPSDDLLSQVVSAVSPDWVQLHGQESLERVRDIRSVYGVRVMKAIGVAETKDLEAVDVYRQVADAILLDAKPPKEAAYPGGHGRPFDWSILRAISPQQPFMLSGGLDPETVARAIQAVDSLGVSLAGVDVSSGVERAPGVKDADKIAAFIIHARRAWSEIAAKHKME
jgi:phosphoribosylanthranilate isomerase